MMQVPNVIADHDHKSLRPRWPWRAIAASLALHAALVTVLMKLSGDSAFSPYQPTTIQVQLLEPERLPASETEPDLIETEPDSRPAQQSLVQDPVTASTDPNDIAGEAPADPELSVPEQETSAPGPGLADEILRAIVEQAEEDYHMPTRDLPWSRRGDPVPGLPGMRGWIATYTSAVTPHSETWKANDGSTRGRHVLADGTVICTQRRAPTIDELMNPWKSLIVTMVRICGREQPAPVDYSNPRAQPPPQRPATPASPN